MAVIDSLIAYWPLDESSGDAIDAHGNNDLTDTNTVGATTGKVGGCRDFELGNAELFTIADNTDLSTGDIDFSVAAWVNLESKATTQAIMARGDNGNNPEYVLQYEAGSDRFRFYVCSGAGFANVTIVTANNLGAVSTSTWYYVVAWHDSVGNTINIQVNDGTADTAAYSAGSYDSALWFGLGCEGFGPATFDGLMDEAAFWKKCLSAGERTFLYNSGNGRSYADIVAEGATTVVPVFMNQYRQRRA
jgi:hypothetical protein